jgi:hypothetical protein
VIVQSGRGETVGRGAGDSQQTGVNGTPRDVQFRAEGEGLQAGTATLRQAL